MRSEHLRDSLEDRIPGQVTVRVVDVTQEVEVGHDERHGPVEALRARQLVRQH
jgi:hypothetical protein